MCDTSHLVPPNKSALASNLPKTNVDTSTGGTSSSNAKEDVPHTVREVPSPGFEVQDHNSDYLWDAVDDVTGSMICQLSAVDAQNQYGGLEPDVDFLVASEELGEDHSSSDYLWQRMDQINDSAFCEPDAIYLNDQKKIGLVDGDVSSSGKSEDCLWQFVLIFFPDNSTLHSANLNRTVTDAGGELETSARRSPLSVIIQIRITTPYCGVWQVVFTMYTPRRSLCTQGWYDHASVETRQSIDHAIASHKKVNPSVVTRVTSWILRLVQQALAASDEALASIRSAVVAVMADAEDSS
jgi:hypothetical protein